MKLLLKKARIIDPSQNIDDQLDLLIDSGKIARLEKNIPFSESDVGSSFKILDLEGAVITPGLIDMHTHLREPGFEYKETIQSGSEAAVAGGFTSIICMANTDPVNDNRSITEFILRKAAMADMANVYPIASVSRKLEGKVLSEFGDLKEGGAVAFSDDGNPVMDSSLMRIALEYAHSLGMIIISHCEDINLSADGVMNEGFYATELGLQGIPAIAEEIMIERDIAIAAYTDASIHIAHVSTAGSVRIIREAKKRGINVTAETAPHYFTLTEEALSGYSTNYKMHPPLRSIKDVQAIKEGLKDSTIDAIATDHAPHSSIEKDVEFEYAANGIIGLETSLSLSLQLVDKGIISLSQLVEKMSTNPARILKIPKGKLSIGSDADVTIIDTEKVWTVDAGKLRSKSRNTPYNGQILKGKAVMTIVGGKIKYDDLQP